MPPAHIALLLVDLACLSKRCVASRPHCCGFTVARRLQVSRRANIGGYSRGSLSLSLSLFVFSRPPLLHVVRVRVSVCLLAEEVKFSPITTATEPVSLHAAPCSLLRCCCRAVGFLLLTSCVRCVQTASVESLTAAAAAELKRSFCLSVFPIFLSE